MKSSICHGIPMRMFSHSVKEHTFGIRTLLFPSLFVQVSRPSLNAWGLPPPSSDTATFCVGVLAVEMRACVTHGIDGGKLREHIDFSLLTCSLYVGFFQYPIAAMLSFELVCTRTTRLLATSFLVSMGLACWRWTFVEDADSRGSAPNFREHHVSISAKLSMFVFVCHTMPMYFKGIGNTMALSEHASVLWAQRSDDR